MTAADRRLAALADAVLLPCFDGTSAPDWIRRRVAGSLAGVCLFARNVAGIDQLAAMNAHLAAERESVVIAVDEEAGDVTRIDAATGSRFPGAAALGRVDDTALTARIAGRVGRLLAEAGISVNFAPCADVARDLSNPVIGSRAFGSDTALVARHAAAWVAGHQQAGVAASTKHFPGHGDTSADSHRSVAVLEYDLATLRSDALPPFQAAIRAGTASIMAGHLLAPQVDDAPASISHRWLTEILRGDLGFDGTIVTDALEMAAVAGPYSIAGAAVRALAAGADLLCLGGITRAPEEVDAIRDAIVDAVRQGHLSEERLDDAAIRSATLGVATVRARRTVDDTAVTPDDADSRTAARQALQVAGPLPALAEPVLVLRCADPGNIAIGGVPWGPAPLLGPRVRDRVIRADEELPLADIRSAGTVLLVTRNRRSTAMTSILHRVRAARSDAVLIDMGISGITASDAPAIASFGATRANARAVVDRLRD